MKLPHDWKTINVPLGLLMAVVATLYTVHLYIDTNYVHAAEFQNYQLAMDERLLTQQKQLLEVEILKLDVKKEVYPQKFDAVDKAVLEKNKEQLIETKKEIEKIRNTKKPK